MEIEFQLANTSVIESVAGGALVIGDEEEEEG